MLHVALDGGVGEVSADQPLGVEDCVAGVDGDLVLGWVSDQSLGVGECNIGGGGSVTLVIGDNLNLKKKKNNCKIKRNIVSNIIKSGFFVKQF